MRDTGLSFARMRLLHELHLGGSLTMGALRARLDVTARNITQLVDALEADGLARRTPHPTDRRATVIELTTAGQQAVSSAFAAHASRAETLFGTLAPEDQADLVRLIDLLTASMAAAGLGAEGDGSPPCGPRCPAPLPSLPPEGPEEEKGEGREKGRGQ